MSCCGAKNRSSILVGGVDSVFTLCVSISAINSVIYFSKTCLSALIAASSFSSVLMRFLPNNIGILLKRIIDNSRCRSDGINSL
jgi:hypothetical protein